MKSNAELYLEHIEHVFGEGYTIRKVEAVDGGPPVHVFIYKDLPEEGMMTFITYGLSEGDHPDWRVGKPELILTLETGDEAWGFAAAYLAAQLRGIKRFSYGDLFTWGEPISGESGMSGFFVFAPAIIDRERQKVELPVKPVNLVGLYPVYREEIDLIQTIGLEKFWHLDGFELYNVNRKNLALEAEI
ncbi:Suppressor of fused protein (SUFU) [Paenibacillus sp. UNCCL117]|uniref:suppressor of fused domain protein n=1 Tax=unclassified Paenibacillus TaxID=185978 RepID=UPI000890E575|nr:MULTISPECIES: suppressor of fused domain protein [unclassified Paenibacillus]SDE44330.1 Suppressor of fused protein (SUFU) [Paenibacillus sp. cl123]SFW46235.1 Suppressor of fused protein (SUFU) [Paenibacillus sp. UNCCL117]